MTENVGIKTVEVVSAVKLSGTQIQEVKTTLESKLKIKIAVTNTVDKTILGGLKFIIDGKVIDNSLLGKLTELKTQFSKSSKE